MAYDRPKIQSTPCSLVLYCPPNRGNFNLVNHVFKNRFPLGDRGPFGAYVMIVIHYGLIKLHLIGMAAYHKQLSEELVIRLIYSFSRVIEHNPAYLTRIYHLLEQSGLATMPYMAILIKN